MTRERNILIVDDDQNMCVDLKEALQDITDNKVLYTESSEKAMDLIETEGNPEMVFMDICLNEESLRGDGENGIALAKKIQRQAPAAEIIFISYVKTKPSVSFTALFVLSVSDDAPPYA